jgi:hypothetical protein
MVCALFLYLAPRLLIRQTPLHTRRVVIHKRRKLLMFNAKMDTRLRGYDGIMNL